MFAWLQQLFRAHELPVEPIEPTTDGGAAGPGNIERFTRLGSVLYPIILHEML